MKKFFFVGSMFFVILFTVSCKKEPIQPTADKMKTLQKPESKKCPEGSVLLGVSLDLDGNIQGGIEIFCNNPSSTFKAVDVTIYRLEPNGNQAVLIHPLLGRPGSSSMVVDYAILPANTIGLGYVIKCYKTAEPKGKPCSVISGNKYL